MSTFKPLGTIQVDVDDLWVYYESIGRPAPQDTPALIYQQGIPRLLDLFDRFAIRATFFVVGRDLPAQAAAVREMVARGHEVANHSTWHRPGFARLSREEKRADLATTHRLILDAAGEPPIGFKSPGFSFNPDQLGVLEELGYLYDSSLLPTFYAPALRGLQRILSGGHVDASHYGRAAHGLAPLQPYHPAEAAPHRPARHIADRTPGIWEAPVTTLPLLRLPMHSTFVLSAGRPLFDAGLALAQARGVPVNYLLHGADVVDAVPDPGLASYRFLRQSWHEKQPLIEHMLAALSHAYRLAPTRELVLAQRDPEP
jgi:peptidoglycan/xylan/chitin deacetylase (PgdA/CDA1 family)